MKESVFVSANGSSRPVRLAVTGLLALALVLAGLALQPAEPAYGASKYTTPVKIKTGKTKKIDLNGGAKEKVALVKSRKVAYRFEDGTPVYEYKYTLKINGKKVKTFTQSPDYGGPWSLYYIDLNKKDKYRELIVRGYPYGDVQPGDEMNIYRYKGGKLVKIKATYYFPTGKMLGNYSYQVKNVSYVKGDALRSYGDGTFKVRYNFDSTSDGKMERRWITFKITGKMKVTRPVTVKSAADAMKAVCAFEDYTYPVSGMTADLRSDGLAAWNKGIEYYRVETRSSQGYQHATWYVDKHGDVFA